MLMIFGGEQYYASGGANDFLCMVKKSKAQITARNLIGTQIIYTEPWDINGICSIDQTIEWTQVMTQEGIILHRFGQAFGPIEGIRDIEYLQRRNK